MRIIAFIEDYKIVNHLLYILELTGHPIWKITDTHSGN